MKRTRLAAIFMASAISACHSTPKSPPTQVVYRFDDHRYLELTGYNCEGALWYTDTQQGIHSEIVDQFYQVFTKKYLHPSERYIAVPFYDVSGFLISKDYGKTWDGASYSPGTGAVKYGDNRPQRDEIDSFTVVNDQGYMLTKNGDLYLSSKPFDDPRLEPGGSGIDYVRTSKKGIDKTMHLRPGEGGGAWGKNYISWNSIQGTMPWTIYAYRSNFQDIPNKVPEVKNYTGWDHMRCDMDFGRSTSEKQK